jgi:hypothetical protein
MREDPTSVVPSGRFAYLDNLKVLMVVGVIVAHATFAWTDVGNWVVKEEQLREPALSLVTVVAAIAGLFGLGLFFLIAGGIHTTVVGSEGASAFPRRPNGAAGCAHALLRHPLQPPSRVG